MAKYPFQYLDFEQPLVDPVTGKITPYFQRQLFGQFNNSENNAKEAEDALSIAESAKAKAEALALRNLIAGTGLTGGGTLEADRTFNLANTAVTPGSYTNTDLTVDAQGRITAAASGSGGSGGGGGLTLIEEKELASASADVTFSSIPGSYTSLKLVLNVRCSGAGELYELRGRFNGDTASNYSYAWQLHNSSGAYGDGGSGAGDPYFYISRMNGSGAPANEGTPVEVRIPFYKYTTFFKGGFATGFQRHGTDSADANRTAAGWSWRNTDAITEINIYPSGGDFVAGSIFRLYGES